MSNLEDIMPEVRRAARTVAYKWPQITTEDDMVQDLSMRLLESPGSVDKLAEMLPAKRLSSLIRIGHQLASMQRDDYDVFTGKFIYSVDEVKTMLKAITSRNRSKAFDSAYADLSYGLDSLDEKNPEHVQAIQDRYVNEVTSGDRFVLRRAVQSLTTEMNRKRTNEQYEYTNGGRFRNNRQARSQVDIDYYGETEEE